MRVVPIPCLRDNYTFLVVCDTTNRAAIVDPAELEPVLQALDDAGAELVAIWNTHHHLDHTGANKALLDRFPELEVIAHESDRGRIPGQTTMAVDGDTVRVGEEVTATIIHNPGHTTGAISYYIPSDGVLLCGDTLFAAGCGRVFEGTYEQMHASLSRLAELPPETRVYCGHEYTLANLDFAVRVEPNNRATAQRRDKVAALREQGRPSIPYQLAEDLDTNPFLRATSPEVVASAVREEAADASSPAQVFAGVRRWKDRS